MLFQTRICKFVLSTNTIKQTIHPTLMWYGIHCLLHSIEGNMSSSVLFSKTLAAMKNRLKPSKSDELNSSSMTANDEDILAKQQRLKEEAKVALVLGAKMARMQVQIERRALKKKKSPLYDIVSIIYLFLLDSTMFSLMQIGINTNGDKPLTVRMLEDMNIGQLQVIVNDLHCQIESMILLFCSTFLY